jgi:hypothetical protein
VVAFPRRTFQPFGCTDETARFHHSRRHGGRVAAAAWRTAAQAAQNWHPCLFQSRAVLERVPGRPARARLYRGAKIQFEFRSADGEPTRLRELALELVRLKVDIIVASQTPAVTAARQATTEIPIVMASAGDPVATGLISSLARPGGNITGLSGTAAEASAKTLELIREVLPSTRRVAVLANAPDPFSRPYVEQIEQAGRALGIAIQTIMVRGVEELDAAFATMDKERADAVMVQGSLPRKPVLDLALKHRLPSTGGACCSREREA